MSEMKKLQLVLCWHMHQPEYRDLNTGEFKLPWTYLHVIKDYVDMVAHLEEVPKAKAVINFAPILLEQIEDYGNQVNDYLQDGVAIQDPLLAALVNPAAPATSHERQSLIKDCFRANRERQINSNPQFRKLVEMGEWAMDHHDTLPYLNDQYITDLLVWYHLAWMGESVKNSDERIKQLLIKGSGYSLDERIEMVTVIGELLASVISRYKALAILGQIEISVTPYAHPILPLMLDIKSTHEAMPGAKLPGLDNYPGGEQRVRWHLQAGLQTFKRFFGFKPVGCWPSEGGVCTETLKILAEEGFQWAASGGNVLHNSLHHSNYDTSEGIHHPFAIDDSGMSCFFRDDGLSDLIGFEYSTWHADDAVADMIKHLENMAAHEPEGSVVSIIMDGENAWEHFPDNGYHFLSGFYQKLSEHPDIEMVTFSESLEKGTDIKHLEKLLAGSWVYGTFATWIGDTAKNRGWDMLGEVKRCFDQVIASGKLSKKTCEEAEYQLAVCEGSDWFWWFGDYNPGEAVSSFEQQFRLNLTNLYQLLGQQPPSYLSLSFTQGSGNPAMGGTMRPGLVD